MRKVILRMKEQIKYELIKKLVETNENKKRANVSLPTIFNIMYEENIISPRSHRITRRRIREQLKIKENMGSSRYFV